MVPFSTTVAANGYRHLGTEIEAATIGSGISAPGALKSLDLPASTAPTDFRDSVTEIRPPHLSPNGSDGVGRIRLGRVPRSNSDCARDWPLASAAGVDP
jgi:hypothetical protein